MTRDNVALQIFIKRMPNEPLLDNNVAWFKSRAVEAFALADLFMSERRVVAPPELVADEEPSGLEAAE